MRLSRAKPTNLVQFRVYLTQLGLVRLNLVQGSCFGLSRLAGLKQGTFRLLKLQNESFMVHVF